VPHPRSRGSVPQARRCNNHAHAKANPPWYCIVAARTPNEPWEAPIAQAPPDELRLCRRRRRPNFGLRSGGDLVQLAAVQAPRPWLQYIPPPNSKHSRPCWPPGSAGPRSARGWACGDPCCAGWFIASSARASCCRVQGQGQSRRPSRRRSRCRPSHSNRSLPPPHHCSNWTTMPGRSRHAVLRRWSQWASLVLPAACDAQCRGRDGATAHHENCTRPISAQPQPN
jgi:hypothetical protein